MDSSSLKGKLLVATPMLGDPNFRRTVVLLLDHSEEGAVGLVLNRPSETALAGPLPQWEPLAADPQVVFVGGPVSRNVLIGLGLRRPDTEATGWSPVVGAVGTLDLDDTDAAVDSLDGVRLFAGYAGWGPGQLEGELEARAWWVLDARPADALSPDPSALWSAVLRRQPPPLRLLATFPDDPTCN